MPAEKISTAKAKEDKLFYFVANAVVFRNSDRRCLLLRRSKEEKVHPGKYATPGGKLEWNDLDLKRPTRMNGDVIDFVNAIENLLAREVMEEANINVEDQMHYINSNAFIRPDGIPVVLVKFAMVYKNGKVKLEEGSFDDYAWVNEQEVHEYDCIEGITEEVEKTVEIFNKLNK